MIIGKGILTITKTIKAMKTTTVLFAALLMSATSSAQVVVVYPNPASETVTVASSDSSHVSVTIYDVLGTAARTISVAPGVKTNIPVRDLPTGRYLVAWTDTEGNSLKVERLEIDH